MLLQPRNSSSKVLGGDKGLLKPENLREKYASQDPGRARLHEQRQCNPEKAEAHTWPLPTAGTVASQACQPRLLVLVRIIAMAIRKALERPAIPQALALDLSGNHCELLLCQC